MPKIHSAVFLIKPQLPLPQFSPNHNHITNFDQDDAEFEPAVAGGRGSGREYLAFLGFTAPALVSC